MYVCMYVRMYVCMYVCMLESLIKPLLSFKPPLPSPFILKCNTSRELAQCDLLMCLKWRGTETTCRVKGQR